MEWVLAFLIRFYRKCHIYRYSDPYKDGCDLPAVVPQSATIACSRGLIFFGDESGAIHVLNETYSSNSFIAHNGPVHQVQAVTQRDILVSIGSVVDQQKIELKVWSIEPDFANDASHQVQARLLYFIRTT